jgi:protein-S-isoprenylcysteine O-methyltransferase Ste14
MKIKTGSIIGLLLATTGLLFLLKNNYIISKNPVVIIIQIFSVGFMIWSRITFGLRSFHATANTTKGKLVTNGPYRILRHPIYASIIYFCWASVIAYPLIQTIGASVLITGGLFLRMILEEKSLLETYDDYAAYSRKVKRIIPFVY